MTSSGTWTKKDDVGSLLVKLVGGGGGGAGTGSGGGTGNGNAGGDTSFGSHATANGGARGTSSNGAGGSGTGDIVISGEAGVTNGTGVQRPSAFLNFYGKGGRGGGKGGGGAGGYVEKVVTSPGSTETVTIGAAGAGATGLTTNGEDGVIGVAIIYEYAK